MARRALKPLTPLLIALVAVALGFLAIGPSFAGTGAPSDGPVPASTTSPSPQVPDAPPAAVPTQSVQPEETVPARPPTPKPKPPKAGPEPSTVSCSNCMAPPGA